MKNSEYYEALGRYVEAIETAERLSKARADKAKKIKEALDDVEDCETAFYNFTPTDVENLLAELKELDTAMKEQVFLASGYAGKCGKSRVELRKPARWQTA